MKEIKYQDMVGLYGYIDLTEEKEKQQKYFEGLKKVLKIRNCYNFYYDNFEKCFKGSFKKNKNTFWFHLVPKDKSKNGGTRLTLRIEDLYNNYTFKYLEEV